MLTNLQHQLGNQGTCLLKLRTSTIVVDVFYRNIFGAISRPMAYLKTEELFQLVGQFLHDIYVVRHYLLLFFGSKLFF